MITRDNEMRRR